MNDSNVMGPWYQFVLANLFVMTINCSVYLFWISRCMSTESIVVRDGVAAYIVTRLREWV